LQGYKEEQKMNNATKAKPKTKAKGKSKENPYPVSEVASFVAIIKELLTKGS
jgi:hypothetical protein